MLIKRINSDNKTIANIYYYLDCDYQIKNNSKFVSFLIRDIKKTKYGYAGFKNKNLLKKHLHSSIFGSAKNIKIYDPKFKEKEVIKIIEKSIKKAHKIIKTRPTEINIFPTFHPFKIKKLSGVSGFCQKEGVIMLDINPAKGWQKALEKTLYHEFAHSIIKKPVKEWTLMDSIIYEGLADNFSEYISQKGPPIWNTKVSLKECRKYFPKIKKMINSKTWRVYDAVFLGKGKYPMWLGYSMGYKIVHSFLKKNPKLKWKKILNLKPKEIFKEYFLNKKSRDRSP